MSLQNTLRDMMPDSVKEALRPVRNVLFRKYDAELSFWRYKHHKEGTFGNSFYKDMMLAMAQEASAEFVRGKVVADFGCGPRGSLAWADSALLRIGIDVLADRYADEFTQDIIAHNMVYVKSTEKVIPLPSNMADIMFTLNAIDHVDHFPTICSEIVRVLKPGGDFIASFNLEEKPSASEPQQLNESIVKNHLLDYLDIQSYRVTRKGPKENIYAPFHDNDLSYEPGQEGILWVRAKKPLP